MKKRIRSLGLLLIVSLVLTELHSIVSFINQPLAYTEMDLFFNPSFHYKLMFEWYIKTTFDDMFFISFSFVAAKVCVQYSYKLFLICWIVFGYWCIDLILFWWNYKLGYFQFYVLITAMILGLSFLIYADEKRTSKYKSLI